MKVAMRLRLDNSLSGLNERIRMVASLGVHVERKVVVFNVCSFMLEMYLKGSNIVCWHFSYCEFAKLASAF